MKLGNKNRERDARALRPMLYRASTPGAVTDHGGLIGLTDDDHSQYVHLSAPRTITGQHSFSPPAPAAPFALGANAQGQLVTGFNADQVDGYHHNQSLLTTASPLFAGLDVYGASDVVTLEVRASSGQTADMQQWNNSVGGNYAKVRSDGRFQIGADSSTITSGIFVAQVATTLPTTYNAGIAVSRTVSLAADTTNQNHGLFFTTTVSGTVNYSVQSGISGFAYANTSGTVATLTGLNIAAGNLHASGQVSNLYGAQIALYSPGTGPVTGAVGLYLGTPTIGSTVPPSSYDALYIIAGATAGVNYAIRTQNGHVTLNETGSATANFRVEGDTDQYNLFSQSSTDRVGIGYSAPAAKLHVMIGAEEQLRLAYDASNYANVNVSSGGNLRIIPTGDIVFDPAGNDIMPATGYDLNLGSITTKYLTLHAAELWVETLVAQSTIATIGGRILVGPTTTLTSDLASGSTSIIVKHNQMAANDIVYMEADGKVEFMQVTAGPTGTGPYTYTVTRNLDGSGANDWYAGDAMFNRGVTGEGWIDIYSVRGVRAGSEAGPTIAGNVNLSNTYNDWTTSWAIGNLNGLYGYGVNTPGIGLGQYSATTEYLTVDATNGIRFFGDGNQTLAQLTGTTWTLGSVLTNEENVRITTAAVEIRSGTDVYTSLSANLLTLGLVSGGEYVAIDSAGVRMYGGNVQHVDLSSAGTFWVGDTATSERVTWDVTNGLRVMNSSNAAVLQVPTSGNMQIVGTVSITSPGTLTAGGGAVTLDSSGMTLLKGITAQNKIKWESSAEIYGYQNTTVNSLMISVLDDGSADRGLFLDVFDGGGDQGISIDTTFGIQISSENISIGSTTGTVGLGGHVTAGDTIVSAGFAPLDANTIYSTFSTALTSGHNIGNVFLSRQTAANTTGSLQGFESYLYYNHTTGTHLLSIGIVSNTEVGGAGHVAEARGVESGVFGSSTGDITSAIAFYSRVFTLNAGNVITNAFHFYAKPDTQTGTITNSYGLYVGNLAGSTKWGVYINDADTHSYFGGMVLVGSATASSFNTAGVIINQGASDDEVLTFKSSDVAHGVTTFLDTNTFGRFGKYDAAAGGMYASGASESVVGMFVQGIDTTGDTAKSTAALAPVVIQAVKKSGTSLTDQAANENLLVVRNNATTRWIVDAEGDTHRDGTDNTYDAWDDVSLLRTFSLEVSPRTAIRDDFDSFLRYNRQDLVNAGILSWNGFYNESALLRLLNGATWQMYKRMRRMEAELVKLGADPTSFQEAQ